MIGAAPPGTYSAKPMKLRALFNSVLVNQGSLRKVVIRAKISSPFEASRTCRIVTPSEPLDRRSQMTEISPNARPSARLKPVEVALYPAGAIRGLSAPSACSTVTPFRCSPRATTLPAADSKNSVRSRSIQPCNGKNRSCFARCRAANHPQHPAHAKATSGIAILARRVTYSLNDISVASRSFSFCRCQFSNLASPSGLLRMSCTISVL
jgi:hypothetical protein